MPKVAVYNAKGESVAERELDDQFFAVAVNPVLVQQVVVAEQANAWASIAHTKNRSEVRGGGKKPWKQKGTGRARHGSIRSPLWRGGGVTFGPRSDVNHSVKLNKKMKRKALLMTLSDKVQGKRFIVLEELATTGKVKDWQDATKKVFATLAEKRRQPKALVVVPSVDSELKRATGNVPGVEAIRADSLNLTALIGHDYTVTTVAGVEAMEQWFAKRN
ncbi:50S ribosomal protein L4 [Candidatus Uhrbacteria bacterium CG10_big_fil_rev_8_21_14_0_10_48_11]|uniref:Large ribosomal subunit protein uL4 n=1 Tax=Candidatus Uhrbacteria bacterium CG10_big_fil_rev_8_21_14_0_10_48_11 TaxID=1975037 RepID=A0A2M8LF00_9BACT|nr:MAG: 50S ribosomal protein L4 [Candidatus Uhrbacteria bacterium CG10_big_fil_rev_8_21_14_0_10_48_11]